MRQNVVKRGLIMAEIIDGKLLAQKIRNELNETLKWLD